VRFQKIFYFLIFFPGLPYKHKIPGILYMVPRPILLIIAGTALFKTGTIRNKKSLPWERDSLEKGAGDLNLSSLR
jgi:hypothetical protein